MPATSAGMTSQLRRPLVSQTSEEHHEAMRLEG
jgi:hypothetical protein